MKSLNQFTTSIILAALTLVACVVRAEFLFSVLHDITSSKYNGDRDMVINIILVINMVVYLILAIFCLLLMYAIVQKNHLLMTPWLFVALLSVICEVIFIIYILASGHKKAVLILLIGTALSLWIIWVIFSLYRKLRQEALVNRDENIRGYRLSANTMEVY
ncbi:uncharacterized protein LOC119611956 [Lucilia sericata]|uniref:uncharacterized protein LOC119611956 n=1 Tax=Lucilia sericata TaxID=13632 RepID=UPI0018A87CDE|nr:uncharacterized protein LOC119611956 [Lucilia sericata]